MYSPRNLPPAFHRVGGLPGNRYESGNFVQEIRGSGYVQTRSDATPGQISYQAACSYGMGALSLGKLYAPRREGHAEPRGEGAELRTNAALSLRGQEGVHVTTEAQHPTQGRLLARDQLIGLTQALGAVARQLGDMARTHELGGLDMSRLDEWLQSLQQWEWGTSTEPDKQGGRKPIMALDSSSGTGMLSHDNLLLGAQSNIDAVAAGHAQVSAGQDIRHLAGGHLEAYADQGDVNITAGQGDVKISAHGGHVTVTGAKSITLAALDELVLSAKAVKVCAEGAQTAWGGGAITEQASGTFAIQSASFAHSGGGGGTPLALHLQGRVLSTDERYVIKHRASGRPKADQRYRIVLGDGRIVQGTTDGQGRTELAAAEAIHIAKVMLLTR
jgi:type VI secretion system secreted protein VgrG